jgi:hypothetical protein
VVSKDVNCEMIDHGIARECPSASYVLKTPKRREIIVLI